jgi:hypothetical protein
MKKLFCSLACSLLCAGCMLPSGDEGSVQSSVPLIFLLIGIIAFFIGLTSIKKMPLPGAVILLLGIVLCLVG